MWTIRRPRMIRTLGSRPLYVCWLFAAALACRGAAAPDGPSQASSAGSAVVAAAAEGTNPGGKEHRSAPVAHEACAAAPASPPTAPRLALESPALEAVAQALVPLVQEAHATALGLRPWDCASERMAGATYELSRYQLGPTACDAELQSVLSSISPMARAAGGWASSVQPLPGLDTASLAAGLSAWPRREEEERSLQKLAENLVRLTQASPSLVILAVDGSGPTMRLAGNAILDNSTREAVLLVGRITAITADRRK
jgi:hypothetical protein